MYFWKTYPSLVHLQDKTAEELTIEFKELSPIIRKDKAEMILDCIKHDGNTFREYQESRDFITRSLERDLEHQKEELAGIDKEIEKILLSFDYKLTSMPGIGTSVASKLIAEIGDIRRFPSANKLARFAGVAPAYFHKNSEDPGYLLKIGEILTKQQEIYEALNIPVPASS